MAAPPEPRAPSPPPQAPAAAAPSSSGRASGYAALSDAYASPSKERPPAAAAAHSPSLRGGSLPGEHADGALAANGVRAAEPAGAASTPNGLPEPAAAPPPLPSSSAGGGTATATATATPHHSRHPSDATSASSLLPSHDRTAGPAGLPSSGSVSKFGASASRCVLCTQRACRSLPNLQHSHTCASACSRPSLPLPPPGRPRQQPPLALAPPCCAALLLLHPAGHTSSRRCSSTSTS